MAGLPRPPHTLVTSLLLALLLLVSAPPPPLSLAQQLLPLPNSDLSALHSLKDSLTDLPGSAFFSTWDFSSLAPCLSFSGLTCSPSDGRVTILSLGDSSGTSRGLAGFLPSSISSLSSLTQLLLSPGIVTGPIPPQLGLLRELRVLSLPHNRLTGPIPESLSALPNLHTLDLSFNQLSASVPAGLPSISTLKVLVLANNLLSGSLPSITSPLLHLDLSRNLLTSSIPPQLPTSLRYLSLTHNSMWGTIDCLDSLRDLAYLDLSENGFEGPIPASLFRPSLSTMLLGRNNFSGEIPDAVNPPDLEPYTPGSVVDLSHNGLTGNLTTVLAGVETLFLNNNHLTGAVPADYVESMYQGRTRTLFLQHNYLTSFPLDNGTALPESATLCLSYNCMAPPVEVTGCPVSAGDQLSRPSLQCSAYGGGGR